LGGENFGFATGIALFEGLADTDDRFETTGEGGVDFFVNQRVGLAENLPAFAVAQDHEADEKLAQHGGADLAGEGARHFEIHILRAEADFLGTAEEFGEFGNGGEGRGYHDFEMSGAFTGEISPAMLRELFVRFVILGHSERRQIFGETDALINKKVHTALACGLKPIVCVGETLEERDAGRETEILTTQLRGSLAGVPAEKISSIVVAYEPVWAIGTGRNATPEQAQDAHAHVRKVLAEISDADTANKVRIQYGGSVKPANAAVLLSQPDIDGALVGGASLEAHGFSEIVKAAVGK